MAQKSKEVVEKKGLLGSVLGNMKSTTFKPVNLKEYENVQFVSTGSVILDRTIKSAGGGVPRGGIVEFFGEESSGKTSMALSSIAENQKQGNPNIYFDRERAFDPSHARNVGINPDDTDTFVVSNADCWEDIYNSIYEIGTQVRNCIFVIDSVNSVKKIKSSDKEEADFSDYQDMGKVSKFLSVETPKLLDMLKDNNNTLICINQVRDKIVTGFQPPAAKMFGPKTQTSGGWALKFYAILRVEFKPTIKETVEITNYLGKKEKVVVAHWIKATTVKSKVSPPKRSGEFLFRFDSGVDNLHSMIQIAIAKKVINRSGSTYYFDENKCVGQANLRAMIEKDNTLMKKLYDMFDKEDLFAIPDMNKASDENTLEEASEDDFSGSEGGFIEVKADEEDY